jgi:AraC-like DNA-binding protein
MAAPHSATRSPRRAQVLIRRTDRARWLLCPPRISVLRRAKHLVWLVHAVSGGAVDLSVNGAPRVRRQVAAGDTLILWPGARLEAQMAEPFEIVLCSLDQARFRALVEATAGEGVWTLPTTLCPAEDGVSGLFREARRAILRDTRPCPLFLEKLGEAITARIVGHHLEIADAPDRRLTLTLRTLREVFAYIDQNLAQPLALEDLAQVARLGRSHFARAFHAMVGNSPMRFITERRICRARDMLVETDASLAEIAAKVGFSSQSHLTTAFRQSIGITPARYRANLHAR